MEAGKGANMTFFCGIVFSCVLICFVKCEKATTIAEALAKLEEQTGVPATEAVKVELYAQYPPIEKMDSSLLILKNCQKLSLSTNAIETIENLDGLKNLTILSLGRNSIKTLEGLEPVKDTLKELWISYNLIEKLDGVTVLKNLEIELPLLKDLLLIGNPVEESLSASGDYRSKMVEMLPRLKKLEGVPPTINEEEDEEEEW